MKKLINSLILVLFFGAAISSAKTITSDVAQTVASNFFKQNAAKPVKTASLIYTGISTSGEAVFFVYNINSQDGFIIVTADDALSPVIGYSTEGSFVVPEASSNFGYWMQQRKNEIIGDKMQNVQATMEISAQWAAYLNNQAVAQRVTSSVSPLVKTLWGQYAPYNALCPGGSLTGCVATAMAQIMRYWKWPVKGTSSSSYTSNFGINYGVLSANYGNTTYNWNNMPVQCSSANNDVATIMYQCGVSIDMQYSPYLSLAFVTTSDHPVCAQTSYSEYFGYNAATIKGLQKSNYLPSDWINVIEAELNAGRPVQYEGQDTLGAAGHSWVCDGYDANNNLHMNWGYGYNGYYSVDLLNPAGSGSDFTSHQEIIAGIEPQNIAGVASISEAETFHIYPNPVFNQLTIQCSSNIEAANVSIINVLGETMLSYSPLLGRSLSLSKGGVGGEAALDITTISPGMYFLQMKTEHGIDTKRFVKE